MRFALAARLRRLDEQETELFEQLRAWRTGKAREAALPPYIIMNDRTLRGIARNRPNSLVSLAELNGIGPAKVESFGEEILALIGRRKS